MNTVVEQNRRARHFFVEQGFIGDSLHSAFIDAKTGRCVRLRIEVDDKDSLSHLGKIRGEVDGGGGFAHSALLVDEGVDASHLIFDFGFLIVLPQSHGVTKENFTRCL